LVGTSFAIVKVCRAALPILRYKYPYAVVAGTLRVPSAVATATLRKAAVFLASLPEVQAGPLLALLSHGQTVAVTQEMAAVGRPTPEEQVAAIREFAASCGARPFDFLDACPSDELLSLLDDERPQTIALVLSQLPARQSAEALAVMPADVQAAVVGCLATMTQPSLDVIATVAEAVRRRLTGPVSVPITRGMANAVKMFGAMRPATERKLLVGIAEADPDLSRAIRLAMFGPDVAARAVAC
jgi:flagellar motor switch protein FliG